jgi:hypothetical protein
MKSVVIACKAITEECETFERRRSLGGSDRQCLGKIKQQMSQALTTQMMLAKKAAVEPNDNVKHEIEDALRALTTVVVELIRKVDGIARPMTVEEGLYSTPSSTIPVATNGMQVKNTDLQNVKVSFDV